MDNNQKSAADTQVGGTHYVQLVIQPFELIDELNANFFVGNVIKYITRHRAKNGIEDIEKAKHYLQYCIENNIRQKRTIGIFHAVSIIWQYCSYNHMTTTEQEIIQAAYINCPLVAIKKCNQLIAEAYQSKIPPTIKK